MKFFKKKNPKTPSETKISKKEKVLKANPVSSDQKKLAKQQSRVSVLVKRSGKGLKIWFAGVVKEFSRIVWMKPKALWENFGIVLAIVVFLGVCFYIISLIAALI